jgi:hypothetical protein
MAFLHFVIFCDLISSIFRVMCPREQMIARKFIEVHEFWVSIDVGLL